MDEHAHVDFSPTQLVRSVVLGAAQGLWSRCYRIPANMCVPVTVAGPPARAYRHNLILLRRLARPSAWVDLQGVLGGSRATLSRIFTHMVNLVWVRYGPLVSDIYIWKSFFDDFVQHWPGMELLLTT